MRVVKKAKKSASMERGGCTVEGDAAGIGEVSVPEGPPSHHVRSRSAEPLSARVTRRNTLMALGGLVLAVLPWEPLLRRRFSGELRRAGLVSSSSGDVPALDELSRVLRAQVGGSLPLYVVGQLPHGWHPAPLWTFADRESLGRAVFLNPAVLPGRFYRVAFTTGDPDDPQGLLTVSGRVRNEAAADPRWAASGSRSQVGPVETMASGRYFLARVVAETRVEVVVEGLVEHRTQVLEVARSITSG